MSEQQTKFEQDLKAYFPDIYELHQLGKADAWLWDVVNSLLKMRREDCTGWVKIHYTAGHIDDLFEDVSLMANKKKRPGY